MRLALLLLAAFVSSSAFGNNQEKMVTAPALYNGTKSVAGEFLPVGFIQNCTGTAVGDMVIYTASHCVSTGKTIRFDSRFDGKSYQARCTRHPQYNDRTVLNDWALCKIESGSFPSDMPKASFNEEVIPNGEKLLLNGYGAPTFKTHHWGGAPLSRTSGQDMIVCNSVKLGGGDSGGSLFKWSEDRSGKSGFEIVGVNSRADINGNCSYFNRISDQRFGDWVRSYEKDKSVAICGISAKCTGSGPGPSPSPSPSPSPVPPANCWKTYEEFAFCIGTKSIPKCLEKAAQLTACVR